MTGDTIARLRQAGPPPRRPKRRTGLTGFLVMLASGFVASIIVAVLDDLLGAGIVPGALP
jgi:hypothetical protein